MEGQPHRGLGKKRAIQSNDPADLPDEEKSSKPKTAAKLDLADTSGRQLPGSRPFFVYLRELNETIESGGSLSHRDHQQVWHDYLWASQPDATLLEECGGMNALHLRGLLLARGLAFAADRSKTTGTHSMPAETDITAMDEDDSRASVGPSIVDLLPECDDVHVYDSAVESYTARELRDVVEGCQLNMGTVLSRHDPTECRNALLHLFTRFGVLANGAFAGEVMDDLSNVTHIPTEDPKETLFIFTCKALRTFLNIFVILFRVIEIHARAQEIAVCDIDNGVAVMQGSDLNVVGRKYVSAVQEMLKPYHIESSLDEYNVMQQLYFLAPGQRLAYRHNFSGMFHDVSQVTYYHYPDYVRDPQISVDELPDKAMNTLPCIGCIIPQLRVLYDDDDKLPFGSVGGKEWVWIVSVRRVYLWDATRQRLLKSKGTGIMDLTAYYLLCCHGMDFFGKQTETEADSCMEEQVQRVKMTDFGYARLLKRKR